MTPNEEDVRATVAMLMDLEDTPYFSGGRGPSPGHKIRALIESQQRAYLALSERLGNLLAVVHRDGGHYADEHGIEKAVADAMALSSDRIALSERVRVMRERMATMAESHICNGRSEYDQGSDECAKSIARQIRAALSTPEQKD